MKSAARKQKEPVPYDLGFDNERLILPYDCKQGDVVLLEGPPGTFKRTLAINFLIRGLVEGENVLLVGLSDRPSFRPVFQNRVSNLVRKGVQDRLHINTLCKLIQEGAKVVSDVRPHVDKYQQRREKPQGKKGYLSLIDTARENLKPVLEEYPYNEIHKDKRLADIRQAIHNEMFSEDATQRADNAKYSRQCFVYNGLFRFTEIAFKSGYVLPEEFIQAMRNILMLADREKHPISRVVFANIGLLGVSYPLLRSSRTAGDLFLTALVHIIRNYRHISLLMTGATGQYSQADEIISRARALADAVLRCSFCDVFGNRYVVIEGEGLTTGPRGQYSAPSADNARAQKEYGEYTPGVIVPREHRRFSTFEVDMKRLEGLVGFNTRQLHRPGIVFYTFEEGDIHARYNDNIRKLLRYTFGGSGATIEAPGRTSQRIRLETTPVSGGVVEPSEGAGCADPAQEVPGKVERRKLILETDTMVNVEPFSSYDSEALHSSLDQFGGQPLDKTIACTVDEFFLTEEPCRDPTAASEKARDAFINLGKYPTDKGDLIEPFRHFQGSDTNYIWPYYSNVLLLVYRFLDDNGNEILPKNSTNKCPPPPWRSWRDVHKFAAYLAKQLKKGSSNPAQDYCEFEYYHCVSETLSCLLLDALVSGSSPKPRAGQEKVDWVWLLGAKKLTNEQIKELRALQDLLVASEKARPYTPKSIEPRTLREETPYIKANASVYLCWYSQLRELLELHPKLADKVKVASLPGGGFRGDWYIGVSRGSVSNELGKQLVHMLCSEREQYKRFALGVGLPTLQSFRKPDNNYFAWLYGENVPVKLLYDIHSHDQTNTRREIPDYNNFRSTLTTICQQLIRPDYDKLTTKPGDLEKKVKLNVGRLFRQIAMLSDKYGSHNTVKVP